MKPYLIRLCIHAFTPCHLDAINTRGLAEWHFRCQSIEMEPPCIEWVGDGLLARFCLLTRRSGFPAYGRQTWINPGFPGAGLGFWRLRHSGGFLLQDQPLGPGAPNLGGR